MKKAIKISFLAILICTLVLGLFVGAVLIEDRIKSPTEFNHFKYQNESEFWENSQKYGYTLMPGLFEKERSEWEFSTTLYYKNRELVRTRNVWQISFKDTESFELVRVDITTNPSNSMLSKLTKNQWMNGIKKHVNATNEWYELVETTVSNVTINGIVYMVRNNDERKYCMALSCDASKDLNVKISLTLPIEGENHDKDGLYNKCLETVSTILENVVLCY